ncbi:MAG: hypothetical protein HYZ49_16415 [Chloroflexi bacterium]|nr:hypothetical protein [Chloroflexota bacterium]
MRINTQDANGANNTVVDSTVSKKHWVYAIVCSLLGIVWIYLAVDSIQGYAWRFGATVKENPDWIPLLAAIAFASGWFMIYFAEHIKKRKFVLALLTFGFVLGLALLEEMVFKFSSLNLVFRLFMSGMFLKLSTVFTHFQRQPQ